VEKPATSETALSYLSSDQKERREHGLRILARMIATAHIRQVREAEVRNSQLTDDAGLRQNPPPKGGKGAAMISHKKLSGSG